MATAADTLHALGADPMVPRFMPVRDAWFDTDDTFTVTMDAATAGTMLVVTAAGSTNGFAIDGKKCRKSSVLIESIPGTITRELHRE